MTYEDLFIHHAFIKTSQARSYIAGSDENYNLSVTATLEKIVIFRGGTNTNTQITIIQDIKW